MRVTGSPCGWWRVDAVDGAPTRPLLLRALERVVHVREHGVDVLADESEYGDRGDRDERQDQRVLDHRLAVLAVAQLRHRRRDELEHCCSPPWGFAPIRVRPRDCGRTCRRAVVTAPPPAP